MTIIGDAYIRIRGDTSTFESETRGRVSTLARNIAATIGAAFVIHEGFDFLKQSVEEGREANKVAAATEQVIKTTGAAAGLTAKQYGDLANSISRKVGIDDEEIQRSENLLSTFTNVRDGLGKNQKVFSDATKAITDMSAVQGDLQSNTILVGKALQDPIKGVTALQRVGVKLTDQQKEQVKAFVASGDVMSAQRVILQELGTEFGGQAAAQATAADKFKVTWGNIKEQIGTGLIPIIDKLATFMSEHLPGAIAIAGDAIGSIGRVVGPIVTEVAGGVRAMVAAFRAGGNDITSSGLAGAMERIGLVARATFDWIKTNVGPIIQSLVSFLGDNLKPILVTVGGYFAYLAGSAAIGAVVAGVGALVAVLTSPVTLLVALGAGVIYAYTHFQTFHDIVDGVLKFLTGTAAPALEKFAGFVIDQIGTAVDFVREIWPQVSEVIGHVLRVVTEIVERVTGAVMVVWRAWGDDIVRFVKASFDAVRTIVEGVVNVIAGIIRTVLAIINGDWGKAWDGLKQIVSGVWEGIRGIVQLGIDTVKGIIGGVLSSIGAIWNAGWDAMRSFFDGVWEGIKGIAREALGFLLDKFLAVAEAIVNAAARAFGWVPGIGGKLREAAREIESFRDQANASLSGIKDKTINLRIVETTERIGTGGLQARAKGGPVLAGVPYIVGEHRPEVFVPDVRGKILPRVPAGAIVDKVNASTSTSRRELTSRTDVSKRTELAVFHTGGLVTARLPKIPGMAGDERLITVQVGEVVVPKAVVDAATRPALAPARAVAEAVKPSSATPSDVAPSPVSRATPALTPARPSPVAARLDAVVDMDALERDTVDKVRAVATRAAEAFTASFVAQGASITAAFQGTITARMDDAAPAFRREVLTMVQAGSDAIEARSPSRVTARLIGAPFVQGIVAGIKDSRADVNRVVADTLTAAAATPTPVVDVAPATRPRSVDLRPVPVSSSSPSPVLPTERPVPRSAVAAVVAPILAPVRAVVNAVRSSTETLNRSVTSSETVARVVQESLVPAVAAPPPPAPVARPPASRSTGASPTPSGARTELGRSVGETVKTINAAAVPARSAGSKLATSISDGIRSTIAPKMKATAVAFKDQVLTVVTAGRTAIEARSPSRLTARVIGVPFVQGIAKGIEDTRADVERAVADILVSVSAPSIPALTMPAGAAVPRAGVPAASVISPSGPASGGNTPARTAGALGGGGLSISAPISIDVTIQGNADAEMVTKALRDVARTEVTQALARVVRSANAGTGRA